MEKFHYREHMHKQRGWRLNFGEVQDQDEERRTLSSGEIYPVDGNKCQGQDCAKTDH